MIANTSGSTSAKTEVSYASIKEKALHDIACAILEQAVVDWEAIERGNLTSITSTITPGSTSTNCWSSSGATGSTRW
jgi:hypothetical protein